MIYKKIIIFNDLRFYDFEDLDINELINKRLLCMFPSGPGLTNIFNDISYYNSLKSADILFFDSGLFCMLLKLKRINVSKYSGYKFIVNFVNFMKNNSKFKMKDILFIEPCTSNKHANESFFNGIGLDYSNFYIAPIYKNIILDLKLLNKIKSHMPKIIVINIGGGVQELLAKYITDNLGRNKYCILCTGAALSFLNGNQAKINPLFDKLFLGWLLRCFYNPKIFVFRYLVSLKFLWIFVKSWRFIKVSYH